MAKICLIVPMHDCAATLPRCLDSIKKQSYADIEIVMVDDGSSDASVNLCEAAAEQDTRVRLIRQAYGGATAARKKGLRATNADYVAFVDADDYLEPDFCTCLLKMAEEGKAKLAVGGHYVEQDGKRKAVGSCLPEVFFDRNALVNQVFPKLFHNDFRDDWSVYPYLWGKLYRKEELLPLLENVDDEIVLGEDVCTTFPYVLGSQSMTLTNRPLYHYVQAENTLFRTHLGPKDITKCKRIFQIVKPYCLAEVDAGGLLAQLRRYMLTTILLPRSPWLLSGWMEYQPYIFPFRDVPRGSLVIVYGAGIFGTALHDFLVQTKFAKCVLWLDQRAVLLRESGLDIYALSEVRAWPDHDFLLVPIMKASTAATVVRNLLAAGEPQEKIRCLNEAYATSNTVWQLFGMEDC